MTDDLGAAMRTRSSCFPILTKRRWAERLTPEFRSGACHAGRYEGSIVLAERPDLVRADVMAGARAESAARSSMPSAAATRRSRRPAARMRISVSPAEATAEEGRAIVEALGAILEEAVVEAMTKTWRPAAAGPRRA